MMADINLVIFGLCAVEFACGLGTGVIVAFALSAYWGGELL